MTDEANVLPSDGGASEIVQADVQTPAIAPAEASKPAASSREALERAFQSATEQTPEPKPDRARDEAGKFAKADPAKPATSVTGEPPKGTPATAVAVTGDLLKPEAKPVVNAPAGFTKAAADAWGQTPEPVRADVERRLTELTQGIEGYKAQVEPIRKYADMAKQHGTTLDAALANYTGMEEMLSRDFVGGVRLLCQNMGINPAQLVASLSGQQVNGANGQPSAEVSQLRQYIQSLEQKLGGIEQKFSGFETSFQDTRAAEMIERFASSHPHFDELRPSISEMLTTGFAKDLADAYEKSVRLNPDVFAKVEAEKAAKAAPQTITPNPDQTRTKAALSVTGSPPVGSNPSSRKPAGSTRESLQNAFAQVGI